MPSFLQARLANPKFGADNVGALINRYVEAVLSSGKFAGTMQEFDCAIYDWDDNGIARQQITLPREFLTPIGARYNLGQGRSSGLGIQFQWFQYMNTAPRSYGWWNSNQNNCAGQMQDMGQFSTFRDISVDAQLRIRTDFDETGEIYIRGTDSNGEMIYKELAPDNVIEGTRLSLATNPATTTETFLAGSKIAVVKPITNGPVRIYSWDGAAETLLAIYQPGEQIPAYRRLAVPNSNYASMRVAAKRRFVPLIADNDLVIPDNGVALTRGLEALGYEDAHNTSDAKEYWGLCYEMLNAGLREEQGNFPRTFKIFGTTSFGNVRSMQ